MLEKREIQRLLDIGFLGCNRGYAALSRKVIAGLDQVLDSSVELEICRAMGHYTVDEFDAARDILNAALERFPGEAMVLTHLALAEGLAGETDAARNRLEGVMADSKDEAAKTLAGKLLEECC